MQKELRIRDVSVSDKIRVYLYNEEVIYSLKDMYIIELSQEECFYRGIETDLDILDLKTAIVELVDNKIVAHNIKSKLPWKHMIIESVMNTEMLNIWDMLLVNPKDNNDRVILPTLGSTRRAVNIHSMEDLHKRSDVMVLKNEDGTYNYVIKGDW